MKNKIIYILVLCSCILYNCKDSSIRQIAESQKKNSSDTIISHINKDCDTNIEHNIYNYMLCKSWKSLNEKEIKKVLSYAKEENNSEVLHLIEPETPFWINANLKVNTKEYKIGINGNSYIRLKDIASNEKIMTFDSKNRLKVEKYFIRSLTEDDDLNYNKKIINLKKI